MAKTAKPAAGWIDITMPFGHPGGTWPGDAPLAVDWTARLGDEGPLGVNLSRICSSPHNGTHSDAPFHVLRDGAKSESLDFRAFMGPCRILDATAETGDELSTDLLSRATAGGATRVLFKTRKGPTAAKFPKKFRGVSDTLAGGLVQQGVILVGTDAPSIESFVRPGLKTHRELLGNGVHILENLDLSAVEEGMYGLLALPLKVSGLCAAPVRAIVQSLEEPKGSAD